LPTLRPCLPLSGFFCFGQHDQRAGQFVGVKRVSPRGDDELAELPHLSGLQLFGFVVERLQLRVKVSRFAHDILRKLRRLSMEE
jgi:hypothetical protein